MACSPHAARALLGSLVQVLDQPLAVLVADAHIVLGANGVGETFDHRERLVAGCEQVADAVFCCHIGRLNGSRGAETVGVEVHGGPLAPFYVTVLSLKAR